MNHSADQFVALIAKSNFLARDRIDAAREAINGLSESHAIARRLIQRGFLSRWQAEQIVAGRYEVMLGKYRVLDELSAGATTRNYLAEQPHMSRRVVLQTLSRLASQDSAAVGRLQAVAAVLAGLDHHNIVHLFDIEQDGDRCFLVIEHLEGADLRERIATDGPLDFETASKFLRQAADGLDYAHQQGISHLAIHPGNLWIDNNGTLKIRNFGLRQFDEEDNGRSEYLDYAAPEKSRAEGFDDRRCDLYSLGCALFFILTGKPPSANRSSDSQVDATSAALPPAVSEFRPDAPAELVTICGKLMAEHPEDRYDSAGDVVKALDGWLDASRATAANPARAKPLVAKRLVAKPLPATPAARPARVAPATRLPIQAVPDTTFVRRPGNSRRKTVQALWAITLVGAGSLAVAIALMVFSNRSAPTTDPPGEQVAELTFAGERADGGDDSQTNRNELDDSADDKPEAQAANVEQEPTSTDVPDSNVIEGEHQNVETPHSEPPARPEESLGESENAAPSASTPDPGTAVPTPTSPAPLAKEQSSETLASASPKNQHVNGVRPGDQGGGQNVFRNVPEAAKYTLVYDLEIPSTAAFNTNPVPYKVDNSSRIRQDFSRIAYYVELNDGSGLKWVYVSMDAFTDDVKKIGIPSRGPNGSFDSPAGSFQRGVANMNVFASENAGVTTGTGITTGNIEFWSTNYGGQNAAGVPGARGGKVYDWGDEKAEDAGYGSMQIHNYQAGQTLFAYNAWGLGNGEAGIGNQPTGNPDWTFSNNIKTYSVKNLQILVLAAGTVSIAKLPPIGNGESQPIELLEDVSLATDTDLDVKLIGGEMASRNPAWRPQADTPAEAPDESVDAAVEDVDSAALQFRLSPVDQSPGARQWDIVHYPKPNSDGDSVARLTREPSNVTFRWTAAAAEHELSAHLCNCLLEISSADTTHVVALREPVTVPVIEIGREMKGAATRPITIEYLPDPRAVMVQITRLDGEFPNAEFRPARMMDAVQGECFARFGPPGQKRVLLGFQSTLKSSLQLKIAPYFLVDFEPAPIALTRRNIDDVQQRAKRLEPELVRQLDYAKKSPPQTPRRDEAIGALNRRVAQCQSVPVQIGELREQFNTYYADGQGKATIHYRVFLKAGDHQVDLLTTEQSGR